MMIHDHPVYGFRMPRRAYRRLYLGIKQKPHGKMKKSAFERIQQLYLKNVWMPACVEYLREESKFLSHFRKVSNEHSR